MKIEEGRIPAPCYMNEEEKTDRILKLNDLYNQRIISYAEWLAATSIYEDEN